MDFNALQHKLFELDPSDPAADKRALIAQAQGSLPDAKPTVDYVNESVEVPQGSMPLGIDSIADFAALAGVRIDEKQKMGSAGQAKGKDPMPKAEPGRTKHPLKDKLVGEAPQGFKAGFKGYNKIDPWLGGGDTTSSKSTKKDTTDPAKEKPVAKPGPVQTPPDTVAVEPKAPTPQAPSEIPAGTKFYDANGGLHRWEGNMWTTINDEKKWQSGVLTNKKGFALYLDALRNGKAFVPKNIQGGNTQPNRTEDIKARLFAALEAEKSKPVIKPRDPNAQTMQDLRKSGAMGAHKDKKKLAKQGYTKHKGKMDESKMSFDDMMKNREFYYTYKQYVRGNANIDQVAEIVRGRVDKEQFAKEIHKQGVMMGGSKGDRIKELADYIKKDSNVLDLPGKAFKKIKKFAGLGESYTKVDGMEAEELRKQYAKDWEIRKGKYLYKKVAFDDYNTVLRFLMVIEKPQIELDHFADIKFFYNEAELIVYTHDTKGLTTDDFKLAVQIDRALERMGAKEIG
jgi:pterin-4a-carbinolamine dehydratase